MVVPRDELADAADAMAAKVALVPPVTAQAVKASINATVDRMGQRDSWRHHFMVHQFVSNTDTALGPGRRTGRRRDGSRTPGAVGPGPAPAEPT